MSSNNPSNIQPPRQLQDNAGSGVDPPVSAGNPESTVRPRLHENMGSGVDPPVSAGNPELTERPRLHENMEIKELIREAVLEIRHDYSMLEEIKNGFRQVLKDVMTEVFQLNPEGDGASEMVELDDATINRTGNDVSSHVFETFDASNRGAGLDDSSQVQEVDATNHGGYKRPSNEEDVPRPNKRPKYSNNWLEEKLESAMTVIRKGKQVFQLLRCTKCDVVLSARGAHVPYNMFCGHLMCKACVQSLDADGNMYECPLDGKIPEKEVASTKAEALISYLEQGAELKQSLEQFQED